MVSKGLILEIVNIIWQDKTIFNQLRVFLENKTSPMNQGIIKQIITDSIFSLNYLSKSKSPLINIKKLQNFNQNDYFEGIFLLLLKLNEFKNLLMRPNLKNRIQLIIPLKINEIISPYPIDKLIDLYTSVKKQLLNVNRNQDSLLPVLDLVICEITTLLQNDQKKYSEFLLFLEKKNPIVKLAILEILRQN